MQKATVLKNTPLTEDIFELKLKPENPFKFSAGQFITIKIDDGNQAPCFRAYSIASPPKEQTLKLIIKVIPNGRGSNWLHSLKTNDQIQFLGPSGELTFQTPPEKTALFIATGTGIAPFVSILEENSPKNTKTIWGLRSEKDIHLQDLIKKHDINLTLSRPETNNHNKGRVTELLKSLDLAPENTEAYICGLKQMVEDVTVILKEKNIPNFSIHTERYD